mmetsp:Transcript_1625/g.2877  ORF Transcript_1625/g.2877 Transcript_1625/m.2877 type:complete len:214 (-) Transcript_1625:401-1042(-)
MHGFAGSGALFFKILKQLTDHFCLVLIDIVGMGGSSRPENFDKHTFSPQQSLDYFLTYIENWRVAMGNLTDFYLAGHSFGGYITGSYAAKYHRHIKKLILLSPVGIRVKPEGEDEWNRFERKSKEAQEQGIKPPPAFFRMVMIYVWKNKVSPFAIARFLGQKQTRKLIEGYVGRRQATNDEYMKQDVADYMYHLLMRRSSTECSIMVLFTCGL